MGDKAGNLYYQHTDVGFVYKGLTDRIDLGFNYRQIFEDDSKGEQRREDRPHLNFTLKGKLSGISISDRSRFEFRCREKKEDVWRYRNKITFKLPFELTALKLKPYLADELFFDLDKKGYNRNRLYGGVSFGFTKSIKGEVYYLWQSSRSGSGRENINVIGTKLKFYF